MKQDSKPAKKPAGRRGRPKVPPVEKMSLNVLVTLDLHSRVKACAEKDRRSMAQFVIVSLERYCKEVENR